VTTSPIRGNVKGGTIITAVTGTRYFLTTDEAKTRSKSQPIKGFKLPFLAGSFQRK